MNTKTRWAVMALLVIAAGCLMAFDLVAANHLFLIAPVAAVALEDLPELANELKKKQDEVTTLGRELLADREAGRKSTDELKQKVDEGLTASGEIKQRMTELEQAVAKGLKNLEAANDEGSDLRTALDGAQENIKDFVERRQMGKQVDIAISRKALTNSGVTGAALVYPGQAAFAGALSPLVRRLTVRDLLAKGRTKSPVIFYVRESGYTSNAAPVSEGSLKPKSEITFEQITEVVRTIAHLQDISLQMLDDVDFIQSYIEGRMTYQLKLVEEAQLLTGSGTGQNLEGIYTAATAYSQPSGLAIGGTASETDLDKLRFAMLQVELANAFTTGIVLHPTDWANIETLKDTTGRYIIANPQDTTTGRVWGRDVVSTQAMTQGKFLVGDFAAHAQIFDRQDANVAISFENKDNFERNMATLRVEERLALAIYRPEAFIKGTLESAS